MKKIETNTIGKTILSGDILVILGLRLTLKRYEYKFNQSIGLGILLLFNNSHSKIHNWLFIVKFKKRQHSN